MCKFAVLFVSVAALAAVLPYASATLASSKQALKTMRANLQTANIANEYIYDRNPNVLTDCTNRRKKAGDSTIFTQYINGCVAKALGHTTLNMKLKQTLTLFIDEALGTATTIERLDRVTEIIACSIAISLGSGK